MWESFGANINNSFYFVIDKITDMMVYFLDVSHGLFRIVLLIALLTAALNYALTGSGLKENLIKILKATLFFLIVTAVYPRIIGSITTLTFNLAQGSVYDSVKKHFDNVVEEFSWTNNYSISTGSKVDSYNPDIMSSQVQQDIVKTANISTNYQTFTQTYTTKITNDKSGLFSNIIQNKTNKKTGFNYNVVAPANVMKIVFFLAGECIKYADSNKIKKTLLPEFSRILKGLVCAGVLIFTGCFALLEYVVCFLEFMLVASVGIILLPFSVWEGSKFLAEGFIKAIFGFTVKLLFCNLAIFLLLYGFITLFYIISAKVDEKIVGFSGNVEEIIFIVFTSLLFFFICKSAPAVAQSLISGSPSLTGAGAIGAVAGAVGAAAGVGGMAKGAVNKVTDSGKSNVGGVAKIGGSLIEAGAAAKAAGLAGNSQGGAFMRSLARNASQGLARSLTGGKSADKSIGDIINDKKASGTTTGNTNRSI